MSNNKQSSVEWLQAIELERDLTLADWNKAKAMHKEDVKEAWDNVAIDATYGNKFRNFEQYYNKTFGE